MRSPICGPMLLASMIVLSMASTGRAQTVTPPSGTGTPVYLPDEGVDVMAAADGPASTLVVWRQEVASEVAEPELYCARYDATGAAIDGGPYLLASPTSEVRSLGVHYGVGGWLVAWTLEEGEVYGQVVGDDGAPVDTALLYDTAASPFAQNLDIAFTGSDFLVAWEAAGSTAVVGHRVRPDASRITTARLVLAEGTPQWGLAFGDATYVLAFSTRVGSDDRAAIQRIDDRGSLLGAPVVLPAGATGGDLTWRSDRFIAAFHHEAAGLVVSYELAATGTVLAETTLVDLPAPTRVDGAWVSASGQVAWVERSLGIRARDHLAASPTTSVVDTTLTVTRPTFDATDTGFVFRTSPDGALRQAFWAAPPLGEPTRIATRAQRQREPDAAASASQWLTVWRDDRNPAGSDVWATRIAADGTVLDPGGIGVATAERIEFQPKVATDGTHFFVTWLEQRASGIDVVGRLVRADGTTASDVELTVSGGRPLSAGTVLFVGESYLVRIDNGEFARVGTSGAILEPSISVSWPAGFSPSRFAASSTQLLAVDWTSGALGELVLEGVRFLPDGTVLDLTPIEIIRVPSTTVFLPSVASDGTNFMVAWGVTVRSDGGRRAVFADGTLGVARTAGTESLRIPELAYHGGAYWLINHSSDNALDAYAMRLSAEGVALDVPAFPVATTRWSEYVQIAPGPGTEPLVFYSRFVGHPMGHHRIVTSRIDGRSAMGGPCMLDAGCREGTCIDGVCCESACGGGVSTDCLACSTAEGGSEDGLCTRATGTVCRPASGLCDAAETCDGSSDACGTDAVATAGTECRASTGECDEAEVCLGSTAVCPLDGVRSDGSACGDSLMCNGAETCQRGVCVDEAAFTCDDRNLCTTDSCMEPSGCTNAVDPSCCNADVGCEDSDVCTSGRCSGPGGTCTQAPITGCCVTDSDCEDSNACTATRCDLASNRCVVTGVPDCCEADSDCDDANVCSSDRCESRTCTFTLDADCCVSDGDCDDGDVCTQDTCSGPGGGCGFVPIADCCRTEAECDDEDATTDDSCSALTNRCEFIPAPDYCENATDCDDGNACTEDRCESNRCATVAVPGCCVIDRDCEDGLLCTTNACEDGACRAEIARDCCDVDDDCAPSESCVDNDCQPRNESDAGMRLDAMAGADGGLTDGPGPDAGVGADGDGGCGCSAPGAATRGGLPALLLLGLLAVGRRRVRGRR
ncbi:MAG: MYXO-CTERM sorting domain-containing protein [Sandaracinaceae bacterium]